MKREVERTMSLRTLAVLAEQRGLVLKLDDLRRDCREGVVVAQKESGAWKVDICEARRYIDHQLREQGVPFWPSRTGRKSPDGGTAPLTINPPRSPKPLSSAAAKAVAAAMGAIAQVTSSLATDVAEAIAEEDGRKTGFDSEADVEAASSTTLLEDALDAVGQICDTPSIAEDLAPDANHADVDEPLCERLRRVKAVAAEEAAERDSEERLRRLADTVARRAVELGAGAFSRKHSFGSAVSDAIASCRGLSKTNPSNERWSKFSTPESANPDPQVVVEALAEAAASAAAQTQDRTRTQAEDAPEASSLESLGGESAEGRVHDAVNFDVPFEPVHEDVDFEGGWSDPAAENVTPVEETGKKDAERRSALVSLRDLSQGWSVSPGNELPAPAVVERRAQRRRSLFQRVEGLATTRGALPDRLGDLVEQSPFETEVSEGVTAETEGNGDAPVVETEAPDVEVQVDGAKAPVTEEPLAENETLTAESVAEIESTPGASLDDAKEPAEPAPEADAAEPTESADTADALSLDVEEAETLEPVAQAPAVSAVTKEEPATSEAPVVRENETVDEAPVLRDPESPAETEPSIQEVSQLESDTSTEADTPRVVVAPTEADAQPKSEAPAETAIPLASEPNVELESPTPTKGPAETHVSEDIESHSEAEAEAETSEDVSSSVEADQDVEVASAAVAGSNADLDAELDALLSASDDVALDEAIDTHEADSLVFGEGQDDDDLPPYDPARIVEDRDEEGRLLSRLEVVPCPDSEPEQEGFQPDGAYVAYHPDGSESARGFYVEGRLEGSWRQWHQGGAPAVTGQHRHGFPEGEWVFFHPNGTKAREGRFEEGVPVGTWRYWDREGRLVSEDVAGLEFVNR